MPVSVGVGANNPFAIARNNFFRDILTEPHRKCGEAQAEDRKAVFKNQN